MTRSINHPAGQRLTLETGFRALTPTERICRPTVQLPQYPALALISDQLEHAKCGVAGGVHAYTAIQSQAPAGFNFHSMWAAIQWKLLRLGIPPRDDGGHDVVAQMLLYASLTCILDNNECHLWLPRSFFFLSFALGRGKGVKF